MGSLTDPCFARATLPSSQYAEITNGWARLVLGGRFVFNYSACTVYAYMSLSIRPTSIAVQPYRSRDVPNLILCTGISIAPHMHALR